MAEGGLRFLYETVPGRVCLKLLSSRALSSFCGRLMDSPVSAALVPVFVKRCNIDLSDYVMEDIRSFNDFFCRRVKSGRRPVDMEPEHLIAPCDGLLSVWKVTEDTVFPVKQSRYTVTDLLRSRELAAHYEGGFCLVFRLCVDNYHRYCYVDNGRKGRNIFLEGKLHTVRPVALRNVPVFTENCREYTLIRTENFGTVVQMEVGAMLVGRIHNEHGPGEVRRGEEKGRFLYGGSTILLLLQKDTARPDEVFLELSAKGEEVPVRMGQRIGCRVKP